CALSVMAFDLQGLLDPAGSDAFCTDLGGQTQPAPGLIHVPHLTQHAWLDQPRRGLLGEQWQVQGDDLLIATFAQLSDAPGAGCLLAGDPVVVYVRGRVFGGGAGSAYLHGHTVAGAADVAAVPLRLWLPFAAPLADDVGGDDPVHDRAGPLPHRLAVAWQHRQLAAIKRWANDAAYRLGQLCDHFHRRLVDVAESACRQGPVRRACVPGVPMQREVSVEQLLFSCLLGVDRGGITAAAQRCVRLGQHLSLAHSGQGVALIRQFAGAAVALDDEAPDVAVDGQLHFLGPGSGWAHQGKRRPAKQAGRQRPGEAVDITAHADISGIQRRALGQHYQADAVGDHVGLQYVRLGRWLHDNGDGAVVVGVFDAGGYRVEWPRPAPGQLHRQVGLSGRSPG